jgi:AbrB family looped-hinge helix DNA binding protein
MRTPRTKMSRNGQVVIPAKIREDTGIALGTEFAVSVDGRSIILTPKENGHKEKDAAVGDIAADSATDDDAAE